MMPEFWVFYFALMGLMIIAIFIEARLGFPLGFVHYVFMPLPPFLKRISFNGKYWYGLSKEFKFVWNKELPNAG